MSGTAGNPHHRPESPRPPLAASRSQCTFKIVEEFAPVPEAEVRHVLEYTERQRFKFKLSRWQCRDLLETMCAYDAKLRTRRLFDELSLG